MMSFISGVLLAMLEKELAAETPEIEAYVLKVLGELSADVVSYVEKKIAAKVSPSPLQSPLPYTGE